MDKKKRRRLRDYTAETLGVLLQSSPQVLVHFGTDWCTPCKRLERVLNELLEQEKLSLPVAKVNVEDQPDLAKLHNVMKNPTLCFFEDGEQKRAHLGYAQPHQILAFVGT